MLQYHGQLNMLEKHLVDYSRRAERLELEQITTLEPTEHSLALIEQRKRLKRTQASIVEDLLDK